MSKTIRAGEIFVGCEILRFTFPATVKAIQREGELISFHFEDFYPPFGWFHYAEEIPIVDKQYKIKSEAGVEFDVTPEQMATIIYKRESDPDCKILGTLVGDSSCVMMRWKNMVLGIEKDGHSHS